MGDAISRQRAIRWVKTECNPYGKPTLDFESGKKVIEHLEQMPSLQSEPHWIPVTGRLPEVGKNVLLSYFDEITIGWLNNDGLWSIYDGWKCVNADEVSAWMPLPEPFKEVTT